MSLTNNQVMALNSIKHCKKGWMGKEKLIISMAKSYGTQLTEDKVRWYMETHLPLEERRIKKQHFNDSQSGKLMNKYTPAKLKGFTKVVNPVVGKLYHISWAFSGACFKLIKIDGDTCFLDNPKHRRHSLLTCKVDDLYNLR